MKNAPLTSAGAKDHVYLNAGTYISKGGELHVVECNLWLRRKTMFCTVLIKSTPIPRIAHILVFQRVTRKSR